MKYKEYVKPGAKEVQAWLGHMCAQGWGSSCTEVVRTIYARRAQWDSLVTQYVGRLGAGALSWGNCFSHAVFLCAVLRALAYGADHCVVLVTCHDVEPFERALHATVAVYDGDGWYCVDAAKPRQEDAIMQLGNLEELLRTNPYVCMFNDRRWQVAKR